MERAAQVLVFELLAHVTLTQDGNMARTVSDTEPPITALYLIEEEEEVVEERLYLRSNTRERVGGLFHHDVFAG